MRWSPLQIEILLHLYARTDNPDLTVPVQRRAIKFFLTYDLVRPRAGARYVLTDRGRALVQQFLSVYIPRVAYMDDGGNEITWVEPPAAPNDESRKETS